MIWEQFIKKYDIRVVKYLIKEQNKIDKLGFKTILAYSYDFNSQSIIITYNYSFDDINFHISRVTLSEEIIDSYLCELFEIFLRTKYSSNIDKVVSIKCSFNKATWELKYMYNNQEYIQDITEEEIDNLLDEAFKVDIDGSSNWLDSDIEKPKKCVHPKKRLVKFNTFEYYFCPDCRKEVK